VDGGVWLPALAAWAVNNSTVTASLFSTEATLRYTASFDDAALFAVENSSLQQRDVAAGRHVLAVRAVDLAGNVDDSAAMTAIVVDVTAPPLPSFQLLHERGCFVLPLSEVYVCNSSDAVSFAAACSEAERNDTAPCFVEWRLDVVLQLGGGRDCGSGEVDSSVVSSGAWTRASGPMVAVKPSLDGQYRVWWRAVDAAGNVGVSDRMLLWLDTTPPPREPTFIFEPDAVSFLTTARFELSVTGDASPGRLSFVYELTRGAVVEPLATAPLPEPSNDDVVQLLVGGLVGDESYSLKVWTQDQAGHRSAKAALHTWLVASVTPTVRVVSQPSAVSAFMQPVFVLSAVWGDGTSRQGVVPDASFLVSLVGVSSPHSPCDERGAAPNCSSWCNGTRCQYSPLLDTPQSYTLQVQAVVGGRAGDVVSVLWEYRRCANDQYAVITNGDAIECKACPAGGDCSPENATDIVELRDVVSQRGWWASSTGDGKRFYRCPIEASCEPGSSSSSGNGSIARTKCAEGYGGMLCSTCAVGYFPQFGRCAKCPATESAASVVASIALPLVMVVLLGIMFLIRSLAPRGMMKVGVSMVQIIAAANSAYSIPWPSSFAALQNVLKLFLIDVISLSKADCASPVMYYKTLLITLLGFKGIIFAAIAASYTLQRLRNNRASTGRWCGKRRGGSGVAASRLTKFSLGWTPVMRAAATSGAAAVSADSGSSRADRASRALRRRRSSLGMAVDVVRRVRWSALFRALFMILFIAYPSVSQKILRTFQCREVEGVFYLSADMRLQCYTREWYGYALYAGIMGVVYVAGLPLSIAIILVVRRHKLFGDNSAETRRVWGFLYDAYGPVAWWWEVEELLRKLFLTALVVLMDPGSPLQVTLAVLVSGWAHVLHAMYKPWRLSAKASENATYMVQHASLLVTSFVFLMGLLFKVEGVSGDSPTYEALSVVMLLLCIGFVAWWSYEMFSGVAAKGCSRLRGRGPGVGVRSQSAAVHKGGSENKAGSPLHASLDGGDGGQLSPGAGEDCGAVSSTTHDDRDADADSGLQPLPRRVAGIAAHGSSRDDVAHVAASIADVGTSFRDLRRASGTTTITNPMHVRQAAVRPPSAPDAELSGAVAGASGGSDGSAALAVYFHPRPGPAPVPADSKSRALRVGLIHRDGPAS
jgi:hypothetical protein